MLILFISSIYETTYVRISRLKIAAPIYMANRENDLLNPMGLPSKLSHICSP